MPGAVDLDAALARAEALAGGGERVLLGIAGPPGAGKSSVAARVAERLGPRAAVVGMDGFHFAQAELARLGREDRKGAPDTFDVGGYVALLRRLREAAEPVTYAPRFRRDLEEPVGSAVPVGRDVGLVVTEGNYLLLEDGGWEAVRPLLDEAWFVDTPVAVRQRRLIDRHVAFGRSPEAARAWALGTDERNAALIEATRDRADLLVRAV